VLSVLKDRAPQIMQKQPPEGLRPHLRDAIASLKARTQAPHPLHEPKAEEMPTSARYQQAINSWVNSHTPAQRQRRYAMGEIIKLSGVDGVSGKPVSVQVMGEALLACGFTQGRDWTNAGRNRRYWSLTNGFKNGNQIQRK